MKFALDQLPVAALATHDGVFVAVNRAFEELTGWQSEDVLGRTLPELLSRLIAPRDRAMLERLAKNRESADPRRGGSFWCRILTGDGVEKPTRVTWMLDENGRDTVTVLVDASPEAFGQEVTEALARVAGALSRCATEEEVLQRAVDALAERGFIATVLIADPEDPLLRYGPSRVPGRATSAPTLPRPPKEILSQLNPRYLERRAIFFQDGARLLQETYSSEIASRLVSSLPVQRMVQAPLFVGDTPYGALVVSGDALSPLVATALDLFAELVGQAIGAVRLRHERVDRERLAALGEAAGVMAHEVRNPVAAIMNALTLIERERDDQERSLLLSIISDEAKRLATVVTQLLELGRPLHPVPREVAMEQIVARAGQLLETRGGLPRRPLDMPQSTGTIAWLDPTLAELALVNVIQNAVQSTNGDGRVCISIEADAEHVRCIVEDDGPGIPDEIRDRLGQPFVTTRPTGTGMGLAVVRRIMAASRGQMLIEHASAKDGTKVVLEFPRPQPSSSQSGA